MSKAKLVTEFLSAVGKEGITKARKLLGSSAERELKSTDSGAKKLDKAKQEFSGKKPDLPKSKKSKSTQKNLRMKKNYEVQEGMGLDAITGRSNSAAADVDKGKAGKVTRSPEPSFLQQERTAGSRARAKAKVEAEQKARKGDKAAALKVKRMEKKDAADTQSAKAKGAASRVKAGSKRSEAVKLPETKTLGTKKAKDTRKPRVDAKTGEIINSEAFDELPINRQISLMRDAVARAEGPEKRRIRAQLEKLLIKQGKTKAGETSVGARKGTKGMSGSEANIKKLDSGATGRGGTNFSIGGVLDKKYTNPVMVLDRRKKK